MSIRNRLISCIIIGVMSFNITAYANKEYSTVENNLSTVDTLEDQLDKLYKSISEKLDMDETYIKELHLLAGGKLIYADKKPDIYKDETVKSLRSPMYIEGSNTIYQKMPGNNIININSEYYIPDALYSVSYDIKALMNQRSYYNRGNMQEYFDALTSTTKNNILFYEAVLIYTGEDIGNVNNLYKAYLEVIVAKDKNENVVKYDDNGALKIKKEFRNILKENNITNENTLRLLAIMLSYDKNLAVYDMVYNIEDECTLPYITNYTSRENMMIAAMSLVGKVRYIWGGGHSGASGIDGINPAWAEFESLYPDTPFNEITKISEDGKEYTYTENNTGFGTCIKPSGSWCPIHGNIRSAFHGEVVYSFNDYISIRKNNFESLNTKYSAYENIIQQMDFSHGINAHTIDGLDCSGFASWLYNQITDKYYFNSTARNFTSQSGIMEQTFGDELLPGDEFSWTSHIVVIVGKVRDNSKAYVTVEQTPNKLKFGVCFYKDATQSDIDLAYQIACEANELIGGIDSSLESPHIYCMNNMGYYTEIIEVEEKNNKDNSNDKNKNYESNNIEKVNNEEEDTIENNSTIPSEIEIELQNTNNIEPDGIEENTHNIDVTNISNQVDDRENSEENSKGNNKENMENIENVEDMNDKHIGNDKKEDINNKQVKDDNKDKKHLEDNENNKIEKTVQKQYVSIGRFSGKFLDDNVNIIDNEIAIKDATAIQIIQHTLTKLPISYIYGYDRYNGKLFNKDCIANNLGITLI